MTVSTLRTSASPQQRTPAKRDRLQRRWRLRPAYFYIAAWLVAVFGPYLWILLTSITPREQFGGGAMIPTRITFDAYAQLLTQTPFLRYLLNSVTVAVGTVALTCIISLLAATALSRRRFRGRRAVLFGILLVQLFPAVLMVVPIYQELRVFGLLDNVLGLILVNTTFAVPFSTWLLKGFIDQIPRELEESAQVDGAGAGRVFWSIVLPLSRSGLAAAGTYAFIFSWNEFLYALTFTSSDSARTVPIGLSLLIGENTIDWQLLTAGGIVAAVPLIVGFMFAQRQLIAGLTAGAVKG
jgi:multiple sugar transport system permease protein